jgi:hypothetical protein
MLPAGPLNPFDWLSLGHNESLGIAQGQAMRGTPGMAAYQRRQIQGPATVAQGAPFYLHSRPYDRGAKAFSPKFGVIPINPIGAGIYSPYKLPAMAGPGARYQFGAIFFDVQTIPTSVRISPSMSVESLYALIAASHVGPSYATTG